MSDPAPPAQAPAPHGTAARDAARRPTPQSASGGGTEHRPLRVMVVCTGNICRSPMAEVVLRERLRSAGLGDVVVDSTGTSDEEVGRPMDHRARAVLLDAGYDPGSGGPGGDHRARQVQPGQVEQRDLVLAMTAGHQWALRRLAPGAADRVVLWRSFDPAASHLRGDQLDVADPWYGGPEDFEACLAQVEAAADGVVTHLGRLRKGMP